jgi:hypothetical protein
VRVTSDRASAGGLALGHNGDIHGVEAFVVLGVGLDSLGADEDGLLAVVNKVLRRTVTPQKTAGSLQRMGSSRVKVITLEKPLSMRRGPGLSILTRGAAAM